MIAGLTDDSGLHLEKACVLALIQLGDEGGSLFNLLSQGSSARGCHVTGTVLDGSRTKKI